MSVPNTDEREVWGLLGHGRRRDLSIDGGALTASAPPHPRRRRHFGCATSGCLQRVNLFTSRPIRLGHVLTLATCRDARPRHASSVHRLTSTAASSQSGRVAVAATAVTLLCCWCAAGAVALPPFPTHVCGHYFSKGQDVIVYDAGQVTCKDATAIAHEFGSGIGVTRHGASLSTYYYTLAGWRGWRCYSTLGEYYCVSRAASAGYRVKGVGV
jgi:hypothetical protein